MKSRNFYINTTYLNKIREWTDEERVLCSISKNNVKHIRSKQAIDEMVAGETLFGKFHLLNNFKKFADNRPQKLSADEVRDILYRITQSDEIKKYIDSVDDSAETERNRV